MKPYPCGHPRTDANTRVRRRYDRPGTVARVCRIYINPKRTRYNRTPVRHIVHA